MSEQTANRKLTSGEWSAVEVITHVKDADGVLNQRVKLLLDQDNPSLEFQAVFEWAESRREASSISDILEAYMKSREETLQRLTDLPFANWWRRGQHQEFQAPNRKIFTITPYVLGDVDRDFSRDTTTTDGAIGGEAKIGLTQSLTLDLTVNTDFAQVEVDDVQVNLTRFPLFFPEKRPFFLENAGSFSVGTARSAELFFSRRIGLSGGEAVPIQGGARMTGKLAGMQVALLGIQASHLDAFDDDLGEEVRVEPPNNFGVVRVFQEFENRTRFGGLFVSRINTNETSDYNLTYAVDGTYGLGEAVNFTGWAAGTKTPGVDGGEYGYSFRGSYDTRDWRLSTSYREIGAELNPEVGFLSRREYRHVTNRILRAYRYPNVE